MISKIFFKCTCSVRAGGGASPYTTLPLWFTIFHSYTTSKPKWKYANGKRKSEYWGRDHQLNVEFTMWEFPKNFRANREGEETFWVNQINLFRFTGLKWGWMLQRIQNIIIFSCGHVYFVNPCNNLVFDTFKHIYQSRDDRFHYPIPLRRVAHP